MELQVQQRSGRIHTILFEEADADVVGQYRWWVQASHAPNLFYACTEVRKSDRRRTSLYMHSLLLGVVGIDHVNGNGLDNRRGNLRPASHALNGANQRPRAGSSTYKGVSWKPSKNKWLAQIMVNSKTRFLGYHASEIDAARAYDAAALEAWDEFAWLNFPVGEVA